MATKLKTTEFAGVGCLIQGLGLGLCFFFPIGTVIGVPLLIYGSWRSINHKCSACHNRVEKDARLCPFCKEPL